jgi:hypothetical protein
VRIAAIVVALAVSIVGVALFARAVASIVSVVKLGKSAPGRGDHRGARWQHMLAETLGIPGCCSGPRSVLRTGSCSSRSVPSSSP